MITALTMAAVYLVLLGVVLVRRTRRNPAEHWLIAYCIYSAALMGLHALVLSGSLALPPLLSEQFLVGIAFMISIGLTSAMILAYLGASLRVLIATGAFSAVWIIGTVVVRLLQVAPLTNFQAWLGPGLPDEIITLGTELAIVGWLLLSLLVLVLIWRAYLIEPLPLYANRILFWVIVGPALLGGDALAAWLRAPWNTIGYVVRALGAVGAVYSVIVLHLIDLREFARRMLSAAILTLLIAVVLFGAITLPAVLTFPGLDNADRWLLRGLTALVVAAFMVPVIQGLRMLLGSLLRPGHTEPTEAVRVYSERIGETVELEALATAASQTIKELLHVNRARLILATQEPTGIVLSPIGATGEGVCAVSADSPIYRQFVENKRALLQYVIDYDKRYIEAPASERHYLAQLGMDIFAPIVSEGELAGLLAVGPKTSDDAFRPGEIELLEALANQTVAALENARLVADLRALNLRMSALNEDLKATNARLEKLDEVKSDFLTIASHELRTPLAQLQGNLEMLLDIAEGGTLAEEKEEAHEMIQALNRASRRMTEVVVAMLDMTQVDVDSMDLVFAETDLGETVGEVAGRYASAAEQRRLMLVTRDLDGLPTISADGKRLTQVLESVISNAVKYTPDGGRIEISGKVYEKDDNGQPQSVQLSVADTGIGVDAEHQKLIFEKFYRVDPVSFHSTGATKFKGAGPGLGLSIARAIVEGHGGRIWVESEGHDEEKYPGSTFNIILPVTPPAIEARGRIHRVQLAQHDTDIRKPSQADEITAG